MEFNHSWSPCCRHWCPIVSMVRCGSRLAEGFQISGCSSKRPRPLPCVLYEGQEGTIILNTSVKAALQSIVDFVKLHLGTVKSQADSSSLH